MLSTERNATQTIEANATPDHFNDRTNNISPKTKKSNKKMILAKLEHAAASAELASALARVKNLAPVFKTWSVVVVNKARANARSKGGRHLWRRIAQATQVSFCGPTGARIECFSCVGAHKETGGPIRVKNKQYLTIPIHEMAKGKTAELLNRSGFPLFRGIGH